MSETKVGSSGSPDCSLPQVEQLLSALYLMALQYCETKAVRGDSGIYFRKSVMTADNLAFKMLLEHGKIKPWQIVEQAANAKITRQRRVTPNVGNGGPLLGVDLFVILLLGREMQIEGEGYAALISALGKIPDDIKLMKMTNTQVEDANFRVIPFIFDDAENPNIVTCIHPDWFSRFDEIIGAK